MSEPSKNLNAPGSPPASPEKLTVYPGAPKKRNRHIARLTPTPIHSPSNSFVEYGSPRTPPPPEEKEQVCPGAPARKQSSTSKSEASIEPALKKLPRIQSAQKCAWCNRYFWSMDELSIYDGNDEEYTGWIVHDSCNINQKFGDV